MAKAANWFSACQTGASVGGKDGNGGQKFCILERCSKRRYRCYQVYGPGRMQTAMLGDNAR